MRYGITIFLLAVGALLGVAAWNWLDRPSVGPALAAALPPPARAAGPLYVGVVGCAGQACHGAAPTANTVTVGNAATHWLAHDRHADAYAVLFTPRSQQMVEKLAVGTVPLAAYRDARCLACHTIPQTVYMQGDDSHVVEDEHSLAMRRNGVGCEACHGASRDWLEPHQQTGWANGRKENYDKHGMKWLNDYRIRAEVCTGCHVGAPADKDHNLPLRDVNHDLIAAGHPRLNFELASYQEAQPPHWVEKDLATDKPRADEPRRWLVGQVVTAERALDLLRDRTRRGPWPEFAESDCFACHHDLAPKGWRLETTDYYKGRPAGAVPWNRWSVSRPFEELLRSRNETALLDSLAAVRAAMDQQSNRITVAEKAQAAAALLRGKYATLVPASGDLSTALYRASTMPRDAGRLGLGSLSWDDAVQYYLLLAALRQTNPGDDKALGDKLIELGNMLSLPRAPQVYDSPRGFRREDTSAKDLRRLFDELRYDGQKPL